MKMNNFLQQNDANETPVFISDYQVKLCNDMINRHNTATGESVTALPPYFVWDNKHNTNYRISAPLLANYIRSTEHFFYVAAPHGGDDAMLYWYGNGCYHLISNRIFKGKIKQYIYSYTCEINVVNIVNEVFNDLNTDINYKSFEELDANENTINFLNGLLNVDTMELRAHSPDEISTIQLPCKWNPNAQSQPIFDSYMDTLTGGDNNVKQLLMEFMGVALSNVAGYRAKKSLLIVGKGNTGKTQLRSLCNMLLGSENVSTADMGVFEQQFGPIQVIGKRLIGSPDLKFKEDRSIEVFKQLTGGDDISCERKFGGSYQYRFKGVIWNCGNDFPRFCGDKGLHVYDRFVVVRCDNIIPENKRDANICEKMYQERESIIVQAVLALKRFIANDYKYDIPPICNNNLREFKYENSQVEEFIASCCEYVKVPTPVSSICSTRVVFAVFREWARFNNYKPLTVRKFRAELACILNNGDVNSLDKISNGYHYYPKIVLNNQARVIYKDLIR